MCSAQAHVRFTPNSDRESDFPQTVMSALPPKADMCSARGHVCFGPEAEHYCDIVTSGRASFIAGFVEPLPFQLMTRQGIMKQVLGWSDLDTSSLFLGHVCQNDGAREDRSSAVSETVDAGIWKS
jgi:hypothetical protein